MRHMKSQKMLTHKEKADVIVYNGLSDLADTMEGMKGQSGYLSKTGHGWNGRPSSEAFKALRGGDESMVAPSDAVLRKIEEGAEFRSSDFEVFNMVSGGVPNVGAFLAGSPLNMRMRRRVYTQGAPIAVVADLTVSADVNEETIRGRGAAALALVRVLSATRPVSLYVTVAMRPHGGKTSIQIIPIETSPLDLARAAFALGDPSMLRQFGFAGACNIPTGCSENGEILWAFNNYRWAQNNIAREVAHITGCGDFVAVPAIYSGTSLGNTETAAQWVMDEAKRLQEAA